MGAIPHSTTTEKPFWVSSSLTRGTTYVSAALNFDNNLQGPPKPFCHHSYRINQHLFSTITNSSCARNLFAARLFSEQVPVIQNKCQVIHFITTQGYSLPAATAFPPTIPSSRCRNLRGLEYSVNDLNEQCQPVMKLSADPEFDDEDALEFSTTWHYMSMIKGTY